MRSIAIIMAGFGNVGKAFARLVYRKYAEIENAYGFDLRITGVSTGKHGCLGMETGFDLEQLASGVLSSSSLPGSTPFRDTLEMIEKSEADVFIENTPVNYESGQPAVDFLTHALEKAMHTVTANKGPVVHAYEKLSDLARQKGKRFLFESTVMDGAPVFSVVREALPAMQIAGFEGILNSCTNLILCRMEEGETFEQAVRYAQSIGIAETDPSGDIDGWDAAVKVAALSTVLLNHPVTPQQVQRNGIREISAADMRSARAAEKRWKLICSAQKTTGGWDLSVAPHMVGAESPFFSVNGTSSYILFKSDVLPGLGLLESDPSPDTTAYGMLADILNIFKQDRVV
ncbi:MAG TPA: homoserine dehydrogenase [Anaerolineaceae bacterium]|nr:homoserine dehydrogenase [Anaerolineaceae bacterium]